MKYFMRLLFSLVTTPRLQLKLTLLSISETSMVLYLHGFDLENTFFRPFLEIAVSAEYFYALSVGKLVSCEVRTSTWPDSARSKYQMFAIHGPPWIVDIETEYILGVSRFRRIGYLCGKRNIYVKSLACWVHFFFCGK